jgi:glycine/D-amino acid oxidase-like deaminating enzyme
VKLDTLSLADLGGSPWELAIPVASVPLPTRADVVVIGAGITGLSAAIALAERGVAVVVADRSFGGGATCRSGGIVLGETLVGPSPEFDRCDLTLRHWIERSQIPCDAVWSGCLELARHANVNVRDTGWVDGAPLRVVGEVPGGMLHPGKFLIGLLHEATRHGVVLCNHLEIHGIDPDRDEVIVRGSSDIRARHVVMAVDALSWSRGFDPWLERTMTVALQTTAVDGLAKAIDLSTPFYTNDFPLLWGRRLPDGSLLFGRSPDRARTSAASVAQECGHPARVGRSDRAHADRHPRACTGPRNRERRLGRRIRRARARAGVYARSYGRGPGDASARSARRERCEPCEQYRERQDFPNFRSSRLM